MAPELARLLEAVDDDALLALLTESVAQYSPSYSEEPVLEIFADRLEAAGIAYLRQPVPSAPGGDHRANLIVELGPQPASLMWVGHVDTIPVIDEEEPGVRQDGDTLYGLGAADMKSGCAAIIEALVVLVKSGIKLKRGLCVALVVGEEEYGDGAEALLERNVSPLTVIGEPTGLTACVGHYGYYECRLSSQGSRAHAALPELGASAIHAMLAWLTSILEEGRRLPFAEELAINPRAIRGGADLFVVADACEAALDIHVPPGVGPEPLQELVEAARERAVATHPGCQLAAEEVYWASGYTHETDHRLLVPLRAAYAAIDMPWDPVAFRSHSDGSLFYQRGSVPVICGPGRLEVAHTRNERVSVAEACQAARLYTALLYHACVA